MGSVLTVTVTIYTLISVVLVEFSPVFLPFFRGLEFPVLPFIISSFCHMRYNKNGNKYTYNKDTKLKFGKHKGQTLSSVILSDPAWVDWALRNVDYFAISVGASEDLDKAMEQYYEDMDNDFRDAYEF
jgi:hypothetical protein